MLKKIIGFLLVLSMIPVMAFADEQAGGTADEPVQVNTEFNNRVEKLTCLGINFDESALDTQAVSRAKFIKTILDFANVGTSSIDFGFYDVDEYHPYSREINTGAERGYMIGYTNGYYYPDRIIKTDEAVKVIVNVLGYESMAMQKGGYPGGYDYVANRIDLLDGVKLSEELSYENFSKLLENALECSVYEVEFDIRAPKYSESEDYDALWAFHHVIKVKDIVTANSITGLKNEAGKTAGNKYAMLGNEKVLTGTSKIAEYLGYTVDAYVKYEKDEDLGTVLYVQENMRNEVVVVKPEDILGNSSAFSAYNFVYLTENGKEEQVKIDGSIIYNGVAKTIYSEADLQPALGKVTLIDNNGDEQIDCVSVLKSETDMIIDYVASGDKGTMLVDMKDGNKTYTYNEDYEDYVIYVDGMRSDVSELASGMSVYIAANGEHSITYAFTNALEGAVTTLRENNGQTIVSINGTEYTLTEGAKNYNIKLKSQGTFYTDDDFHIFGLTEVKVEGLNYGYFIQGYYTEQDIEPQALIKLLTTANEFIRYDLCDMVTINDERMEKTEAINVLRVDGVKTNPWKHQVIMYELDDNEKIKTLYTSVDATKGKSGVLRYEGYFDSTNGTGKEAYSDYGIYANSWANQFFQDAETIVFNINESDLELSYASGYIVNGKHNMFYHEFYNIDPNLNTVDVVVWKKEGGSATAEKIPAGNLPVIVSEVIETVDEDGIPVKTLECYSAGNKISILWNDKAVQSVKDEFNRAKAGDIIYYSMDGLGRLQNLCVAFNSAKLGEYGTAREGYEAHGGVGAYVWFDKLTFYVKMTEKLKNNFFRYEGEPGGTNGNLIQMNKNAKVYKVTKKGDRASVTTISYDDVKPGDEVVFHTKTNVIQFMAVIDFEN